MCLAERLTVSGSCYLNFSLERIFFVLFVMNITLYCTCLSFFNSRVMQFGKNDERKKFIYII